MRKTTLTSNRIFSETFLKLLVFLIGCLSLDALHAIAPAPMIVGGCCMIELGVSASVNVRGPLTVSPEAVFCALSCKY